MIVATILLLILSYLLYAFGLMRATTRPQALRFIPAYVVFGLLLLLTAAFALDERLNTLAPRDMPPVTSLILLDDALANRDGNPDDRVVLVGEVAPLADDAMLFPEAQTVFPMTLAGGDSILVAITSQTHAFNWPRASGQRQLAGSAQIVVVGRPAAEGNQSTINAESIYAGSLQAYYAYIPRFAIIPTLTLILSVIIAIVVIVGPLILWWRLPEAPVELDAGVEPHGE